MNTSTRGLLNRVWVIGLPLRKVTGYRENLVRWIRHVNARNAAIVVVTLLSLWISTDVDCWDRPCRCCRKVELHLVVLCTAVAAVLPDLVEYLLQ